MKVDTDTKRAIRNLFDRFGRSNVKGIRFGKIRRDGTRSVSFFSKGQKGSFSYLTDIKHHY